MTHTMFDDANVNLLPASAYAFAGYIDGFVTYPWLQANRKSSHLLSITVRGNSAARCIDVEPGASSQGQIPGFLSAHRGNAQKPVCYFMAGQATGLCDWLASIGHPRSTYILWTAHVGRGEHICGPATCGLGPGSNGTQWTFTAMGRALDQSIIDDSFFEPPKPKPVPTKEAKGFWRQVAGETTPTESLYDFARKRNTTAHATALHTLAKDSPINAKNRAEFQAYRDSRLSTGGTMPHGLVFYTYKA